MKNIFKKLTLYLLAFTLCLQMPLTVNAAENDTLPSGYTYNEIGAEIEAYVKEHENTMAAMGIAVFDGDQTIYQNHFGYIDKESGLIADDTVVFEWGSVTKTLVWVSVIQLWEQGKIDLETDIRTYLPEDFLTNLNYDTPITMLNLMNHNAGFQEMVSDAYLRDAEDVLSLEEQLYLHQPEQVYEPGTVTSYSNWGTALAGLIVERVSGQPFDEYVQDHIFEPLGMEHTSIRVDLSDNPWVADQRQLLKCYDTEGNPLADSFFYISLYPAGSCTGTLDDFKRYGQSFVSGNTDNCLLFQDPSTLEFFLTATDFYGDTDIPLNCHGLFTSEYAITVLGHGGNSNGCSSYLLFDKESGVGAVVMTNQQYEEIFNISMMELIFGKFADSELADYNAKSPAGVYTTSRTILEGPLSLHSVVFGNLSYSPTEKFWVCTNTNGIEKVVFSGGDMLLLAPSQYVPKIVVTMAFAISLVYALCTCTLGAGVIRPVANLICKKRGIQKNNKAFKRWNYISCGVISLWGLNGLIALSKCIQYEHSSSYIWHFFLNIPLGLVMIGLLGWFILKIKKFEYKTDIMKGIITCLGLLSILIAIVFWDLYQFWMI